MISRAFLITGLAFVALAAPAGAASPHLTAPAYTALKAMIQAADSPAVVGAEDPVAALTKVCRALRTPDAQSRLLGQDCVASTGLTAGALAVLDCPTAGAQEAIAACARAQRTRITRGAARSSAVERRLAAQVSGGCRSYFRSSIAQNGSIAAYYAAVLDNLVTPGTHTDAQVAALQRKLQTTDAQNRSVKRAAARCNPA